MYMTIGGGNGGLGDKFNNYFLKGLEDSEMF